MDIQYTLLTDGSSDRVLLPLLTWLLRQHCPDFAIQPQWADLRRLPRKPRTLAERIALSVELYPCDVLFIHRDAEREEREVRVAEIDAALQELAEGLCDPIRVIPVRMQEAWLLFDEMAIRSAASNPAGTVRLELPVLRRIERLPDPKEVLYRLLREASGLTGRRLRRFQTSRSALRVAEYIDDFSPLRIVPAFRALEADVELWSRS